MYVHPETLPPGGVIYFRRIYLSHLVRTYTCINVSKRSAESSVWELHTPATPPPSLLLSIESTTNLVGHNIFTSIRDRHTWTSKGLAWRLDQVGVQFRRLLSQHLITGYALLRFFLDLSTGSRRDNGYGYYNWVPSHISCYCHLLIKDDKAGKLFTITSDYIIRAKRVSNWYIPPKKSVSSVRQ